MSAMIDGDDDDDGNNNDLETSLRQAKGLSGDLTCATLEHVLFKIYFVLHF